MAGATWSWIGGSGAGTVAANWALVAGTGSGGPQTGDTAIITNGTVVTSPGAQLNGNTVEVGGTAGAIAALSFANGSTLNIAAPTLDATTVVTNAVPGQSTADATVLNIAGTFVNNGEIIADGPAGSTFTINVQPTVTGSITTQGYFLNSGQMEVDTGNALTISVATNAQFQNQGGLNVLNGGTVSITGGGLGIATAAGSSGRVVISGTAGGTSRVTLGTATTGIDVGQSGQGTLEVLSGGSLSVLSNAGTVNPVTIGDDAGASGLMIVSGTSAVVSMGTLTTGLVIGNSGTGELDVLNGGLISLQSALGVEAGVSAGSSGTIKVSGSGASLAAGFPVFGLALGYSGSALLDIESGGSVTANYLEMGFYTGGSGVVTVSGIGSRLTVQTNGSLGIDGTGVLNVASSAVASIGALMMGAGPAGQGTLAVTSGGKVAVINNASISAGSTISVSGSTSGVDIGGSGTYVGGAINLESGHALSGAGVIASAIVNNGQIQSSAGGTLEVKGSISSGTGSLTIGNNSVLQLDSAVASSQSISFGTGSELILNAPATIISNAISGLTIGDKIELNLGTNVSITNVAFSGGTVTINASNGTYKLTNVSFAAGTPTQFSSGVDSVTGDNFIQVQSMTYNWTGGGGADNNFGTAANWDSNLAPTGTNAVSFVTTPGTTTVTGSGSAQTITIGTEGSSYAGTWIFNSGSLSVAGKASSGGLPNAVGFFGNTVLNGETLNAAGGTTNIGGPGSVTVTAQGGSQITTEGDAIGGAGGEIGTLVVSGANTDWIEQSGSAANGVLPGFLTLGSVAGSAGALTVTNGAALSTGATAVLGASAGSSGTATVSFGGLWTASGGALIGQAGSGSLTVNAGTLTTGAQTTIGSAAGSSGTLHVTSGGVLTNGGGLTLGSAGAGALTVDGGSSVTTSGALSLGSSSGGVGTMNVTAATVGVSGATVIGNAGDGTLTVNAGGVIQAAGTFNAVGNNAGANGALVVNNGGTFQVGTAGTIATALNVGNNAGSSGSVIVNAGGTIAFVNSGQTSAAMAIGRAGNSTLEPGASGSVLVTGAGALLNTNGQAVSVGNNAGAQGQLLVEQGGSMAVGSPDSNQIYGLGIANSGGNGAVTVTGVGSTLTSSGYLLDGRGGNGSLTVENDGVVIVTNAGPNGGGIGIGFGRGAGPSAPTNYGGSGTALVTSGGTLEVNSTDSGIGIGGNGASGSLSVTNGGTVLTGAGMTVGSATSANGTVYGGTGQLNIGAGGVVKVNNPIAGNYAVVIGSANSSIGSTTTGSATGAASGEALITGTGAQLNANGAGIAIGWLSTGSMTISQGGSVTSGSPDDTQVNALSIGRRASGSLTITDAGSRYNAQGVAYVGRAGNGSLLIENGGTLISTLDPVNMAGIAIGGIGLGISQNGTATSYLMTGGNGTALLTANGSMSSQQWIKVGTDGTNGSLTVQNGSTADAATQVVIGDSVFVANGDTIITPNGQVISSGSLVTTSGVVNVGAGGTLKTDGMHQQGTADIVVGAGAGANGTMNVTGLGASVNTDGDSLAVGQTGNGQVVISQGGSVVAGTQFNADSAVYLGRDLGSSGFIEVTDAGSSLVANGQIDVGQTGSGSLLVQNKATVISGGNTLAPSQGLDIGRFLGGSGTVSVTGLGSSLSNTGQFVVGDAGTGSLSVQNDATVVTTPGSAVAIAAVIGKQTGSGGSSASVIGAGSTWQIDGMLEVGNATTGALNISNGGTVSANALITAAQSSGGGVITVAGQGSSLNLTGSLTLGSQAAGELSILGGGTVSAAALTIGNAGTLSSGNVDVEGTGSTLKIANSGVLNVGVAGGGSGVLTIGPGATLQYTGTIVEAGHASYNNFGGVIDPDAVEFTTASNAGLGLNDYSLYVGNIGAVQITSGAGTWNTAMVLTGTSAADATNNIDNNGYIGQWQLSQNGTLIINANTIDAGQAIVFGDATDTLVIGQIVNGGSAGTSGVEPVITPGAENLLAAGGFAAQIWGYQAGDQILFNNLTIASDSIVNGNTLDLFDAGNNLLGSLTFYSKAGNRPATASAMQAAAQQVLCFAAGTRIRTARGEVGVEALCAGEGVWSVMSERFEQVQWIGYRTVNCQVHPAPEKVWPVVVSAGAFGPGLPVRDLWLSPDHALYVDDVLIPVKLLVNGTTIRQVAVDTITYYHVELSAHDVVLAEGLPAESYLDVDDRSSFTNGGGPVALHPEFAAHRWELRWEAEACAPLCVLGPQVEAARARLVASAGEAGRAAA